MTSLMLHLLAWVISVGVMCGDIEQHVPKMKCVHFKDSEQVGAYDPWNNIVKVECDGPSYIRDSAMVHELVHACQVHSDRFSNYGSSTDLACTELVNNELEAYNIMDKYLKHKYGNSMITDRWVTQTVSDTYLECREGK